MTLASAIVIASCSPMVYQHGVPNYAVVDANVDGDPYVVRHGQITTTEGWDFVASLAHGRKIHVIKLNFDHEGSDQIAKDRGYDVVYVPIQPEGDMGAWTDIKDTLATPDSANIAKAKATLHYCHEHPLTDFCEVHCTHGQDRTGDVVGEYRVDDDGWTKDAAYREMLAHHFHWELHGLHEHWESFQPRAKP